MADRKSKVVEILLEDLEYFLNRENETQLLNTILNNTKRYIKIFQEAIDKLMPKSKFQLKNETVEEIIMNQRIQNLDNKNIEDLLKRKEKTPLPPELIRT